MTDAECVAFLQWALPQMDLRWSGFRKVRRQVCKRIARRLHALGLPDLTAYRKRLAADREEWLVLDSLCRIPISRFWRDRGVFDHLSAVILPTLAKVAAREGRSVRVWSAGCASGEEPYSLSIAFALGPAGKLGAASPEIIATDADDILLGRARRAVYGGGSLKDLPSRLRKAAFERDGSLYRLRAPLQAPVTLRREDIRDRMPRGPFDLVLCRNLIFTYFARPLQARLAARLVGRLRPGGLLVIGAHERLPDVPGLIPEPGPPGIFRRETPGAA